MHCEAVNPQGYQVLLRYDRADKESKPPLTVTKPEHISAVVNQFKHLRPRTFYASIYLYKDLSRQEHVRDLNNIVYCAPAWDIDNTPEKWSATAQTAKAITTFLREEGVPKSVFVKRSGKAFMCTYTTKLSYHAYLGKLHH